MEPLEKKKMKAACMLAKAVQAHKFGCSAAVKFLLFILIAYSVLNTVKLPPSGSKHERTTSKWPSPVEERQNFNQVNSSDNPQNLVKMAADVQTEESVEGNDTLTEPPEANDRSETENTFIESEKSAEDNSTAFNTTEPSVPSQQRQEELPSIADSPALGTSIKCEFSDHRYNMCSIEAKLKVIGSSATVLIVPSTPTTPSNSTIYKIRPFTRKWEEGTMEKVREITIRWASDEIQGPSCDVIHDVPVLIFATAGFRFNPYHDYTDLLIPLFVAANKYNGKIQFAATNFDWPWINKYLLHLQALSYYPIINLDSETLVHCFPAGQIGLRANEPLSAESPSSQNGSATHEFKQFVRTSLSLKRDRVEIIERQSDKKPKMAILTRQWTRTFTNKKEIIEMAESVGFEVIRADTETTKDFPRIAHLINSCDVLMGLHGAGLTNMIYLPNNATVIQIVPWGDMGFISWKDYGEPTKDLGLNYIEYEIKIEESTLIEKYPRNHTVFTNPQELHKQGWTAMYTVFMVEQSVKLDVNRFREVLVGLFNSLTQ